MQELPSVGVLKECSGCGKLILVERGLIGINHTVFIKATCWDCLNPKAKERAQKMYSLKEKSGSPQLRK